MTTDKYDMVKCNDVRIGCHKNCHIFDIFVVPVTHSHYKHFFMMKCRVRATQWTITMAPAKLVSGVSQ